MHSPSRARRILKWTGFGLSLLYVAVWVASLWFAAEVFVANRFSCSAWAGAINVAAANFDLNTMGGMAKFGTEVSALRSEGLGFQTPSFELREATLSGPPGGWILWATIPFWLLLLLTAIPTAWLWHRDRGWRRPGCCLRCGYDLTGNTSGVCSECGLAAARAQDVRDGLTKYDLKGNGS